MEPFRKPSLVKIFKFSSGAGLLSLMFLLTISAQSQTLAEIARQERERQARVASTRVVTGEGARTSSSAAEPAKTGATAGDQKTLPSTGEAAGTTPSTNAPSAQATAPPRAPAAAPPAPAVDPAKEWNEQLDKLRMKIQELQDQETALQLQVNQLTNQIFAPVSDQNSRDQAQARLGETQNRLTAVRIELDQTKKTLDSMNLQGPPKKP